jgi:hypothetical protein
MRISDDVVIEAVRDETLVKAATLSKRVTPDTSLVASSTAGQIHQRRLAGSCGSHGRLRASEHVLKRSVFCIALCRYFGIQS